MTTTMEQKSESMTNKGGLLKLLMFDGQEHVSVLLPPPAVAKAMICDAMMTNSDFLNYVAASLAAVFAGSPDGNWEQAKAAMDATRNSVKEQFEKL